MRIGIVPRLNRTSGGVYQYTLSMIEALNILQARGSLKDEFVVFKEGGDDAVLSSFTGKGWETVPLSPPTLRRKLLSRVGPILGDGRLRHAAGQLYEKVFPPPEPAGPDQVLSQPAFARLFLDYGIDWMMYPKPMTLSFEAGVPYVIAIPDVQHRIRPEFPEVSANGEWERREYLYRNAARYARMILVDSEVGKEDVLNSYGPYGVTADRIRVLPFVPAHYLHADVAEAEKTQVRETCHLPQRYFFYPAQFWPHKNHLGIVNALGLLREKHRLAVDIVFVGTYACDIRERTFHEVMSLAERLGVERNIHHRGYVSDESMSALYAGAVALVMPTFFGPTNIPPLEAWSLGCPVLTSDIRGVREQMGEAAVLVDPASTESIAEGMRRLWTDTELRRTLIEKGRRRLASYGPEEFRQRLAEIVTEANRWILESGAKR